MTKLDLSAPCPGCGCAIGDHGPGMGCTSSFHYCELDFQ